MCQQVYMPDGRTLACLNDLKSVGFDVTDAADEDWEGDYCLCGVDVEMVLNRAKVTYIDEGFGYTVQSLP